MVNRQQVYLVDIKTSKN